MGSYLFSFIGEYSKALAYADSISPGVGILTPKDSAYFKTLRKTDAIDYIDHRASNEKVIMINEAHHIPMHRIFTLELLDKLYKKGFRYLGLETLNNADSLLNKRKYPITSTGFYSVEPQYGELIREALKLGYALFPYEATDVQTLTDGKAREIFQARQIEKVFRKSNGHGIVINAGFDHIREDSVGGRWGKAMAGRFKEFTGINPLTINQDIVTEKSAQKYENPFFRMIDIDKPSIYLDSNDNVFAGSPSAAPRVDIRVFHPRTKLIAERPDWMFRNGKKKSVFFEVDNAKMKFPCLIKAHNYEEDENVAIPLDIIEVNDRSKKSLVLKPGRYKVVVSDGVNSYFKDLRVK